jgi:hypothetical protein
MVLLFCATVLSFSRRAIVLTQFSVWQQEESLAKVCRQRYQNHKFLALYYQLMEAGRGGVGAYLSIRKGGGTKYLHM